jgi:hypothetical protein
MRMLRAKKMLRANGKKDARGEGQKRCIFGRHYGVNVRV